MGGDIEEDYSHAGGEVQAKEMQKSPMLGAGCRLSSD